MCPRIILNGKCNNKAARKLPCSRTIWYLQIDLGCKRILWGRMSSLFSNIVFFKRRKHMYFLYASGNTQSFIIYIFIFAPWLLTLLECLALGTEKQCTMVKSNYHCSLTLSRLFAQSPNSSDREELSRGCNGRRLQMWSPQNHFHSLWRILREGFHSAVLFLWGALALQRKWSKTLQFLPKWPIERVIDNCIIFITIFSKEK